MTKEQIDAVRDAYTTLRAVYSTYGKADEVIAELCVVSASELVNNFTEVAVLEAAIDGSDLAAEGA